MATPSPFPHASELRSGDVQAGLAARSPASAWPRQAGALGASPSTALRRTRRCPTKTTSSLGSSSTAWKTAYARDEGWPVKPWARCASGCSTHRTTGEELLAVSPGLTPEMVAGVTKLMSNMDLVVAARKIRVVVRCNNTLGLPGTHLVTAAAEPSARLGRGDAGGGPRRLKLRQRRCGDRRQSLDGDRESTVEILTRVKALMTKPSGADAELRAVAHHGPDAGDAAGGAARPVLPVDRRLGGREPELWHQSAPARRGGGDDPRAGHGASGPNVMYFETGRARRCRPTRTTAPTK
jgi:hypothetical protein